MRLKSRESSHRRTRSERLQQMWQAQLRVRLRRQPSLSKSMTILQMPRGNVRSRRAPPSSQNRMETTQAKSSEQPALHLCETPMSVFSVQNSCLFIILQAGALAGIGQLGPADPLSDLDRSSSSTAPISPGRDLHALSTGPAIRNDRDTVEALQKEVLERLSRHTSPPFTLQRICEILCDPGRYYKSTAKLTRGLHRCLQITPEFQTFAPVETIEVGMDEMYLAEDSRVGGAGDGGVNPINSLLPDAAAAAAASSVDTQMNTN
eukprot:m.113671 g.113671  ORF g.113671 m.113671 type:complete len:263 (-) comp13031_c0_seq1:44-832(-)